MFFIRKRYFDTTKDLAIHFSRLAFKSSILICVLCTLYTICYFRPSMDIIVWYPYAIVAFLLIFSFIIIWQNGFFYYDILHRERVKKRIVERLKVLNSLLNMDKDKLNGEYISWNGIQIPLDALDVSKFNKNLEAQIRTTKVELQECSYPVSKPLSYSFLQKLFTRFYLVNHA